MLWKTLEKFFKLLSSLELAVFNILSLAVVLSIGTIYESKYGAAIASQEIYKSFWMQGILWSLLVNVAAVAFSRWPWKKHHVGFLITHLGIIVLLFGSFLTQRLGIDGSLALAPGESARAVKLDETVLNVFRAIPGKNYELLLTAPLELSLLHPLKKPMRFSLKDVNGKDMPLQVINFYPKASRIVKAVDVDKGVPAMHFVLRGSRATIDDWIFLQADKGTRDFGPARVSFQKEKPNARAVPEKPTLYVYFDAVTQQPMLAVGHPKEKALRFLGRAEINKEKALGWMDFAFVITEFHSSAIPSAEYISSTNTMGENYQVIAVEMNGEKIWLELGAAGQIARDGALYYIQYARKQVELGFTIKLQDFRIGYYEGTNRAKSYESVVQVGESTRTISMNEPMKQNGYTLYQASFESDDDGKPVASVLSVNYDPGRFVKYFGSFMIVFGTLSMFYFKPKYSGTNKIFTQKAEDLT